MRGSTPDRRRPHRRSRPAESDRIAGLLAGQRAKDFVRKRMDSVDFIIVSTSKAGKYGR